MNILSLEGESTSRSKWGRVRVGLALIIEVVET